MRSIEVRGMYGVAVGLARLINIIIFVLRDFYSDLISIKYKDIIFRLSALIVLGRERTFKRYNIIKQA
jgi:hypothetical protein